MRKNILNKILLFTIGSLALYPQSLLAEKVSLVNDQVYPSSTSSSSGDNPIVGIIVLIGFLAFGLAVWYERYKIKKIRDNSWKQAEELMLSSSQSDPLWSKETIIDFTKHVFHAYYSAWATFNPSNLERFLSDSCMKKTVLEMSVVKGLSRSFTLNFGTKVSITIVEAKDTQGTLEDTFIAEISYTLKAGSIFSPVKFLRDGKRNILSNETFEYWKFIREKDGWQLDEIWAKYFIRPTLAMPKLEEDIQKFAQENSFYYDPDFGKIILPDKGKLFNKYNDGQVVSSHTIGMWDKKILEFYLFHGCYGSGKNRVCKDYVVAQALLPKSYSNMIVESKKSDIALFSNIGTSLEKVNTESVDFDKVYSTYRDKSDRVNVLELLTPNFMEHLMGVDFPIYIEIVDNILYVATPHKKDGIGYQKMLEVLCWSFDEMKM